MTVPDRRWHVVPGLSEIFRSPRLSTEIFHRNGTSLEVVMRPELTLSELESAVVDGVGRTRMVYWLAKAMTAASAFLVGALLIFSLFILDLFTGLTSSVLLDRSAYSPWTVFLLIASFVVGSVLLGFAPNFILGDGGNLGAWFRRWFNEDERAVARIHLRLKAAIKSGRVTEIVVWNAAEPRAIGIGYLIQALAGLDARVTLRVHRDEVESTSQALTQSATEHAVQLPLQAGAWEYSSLMKFTGNGSQTTIDPFETAERVFGAHASRSLAVALAFSTLNATEAWRQAIDAAHSLPDGLISGPMTALIVDTLGNSATLAKDVPRSGRTRLLRLTNDYALLLPSGIDDGLSLADDIDWEATLLNHPGRVRLAEESARPHLPRLLEGATDPTSLFCYLVTSSIEQLGMWSLRHILNSYIEQAYQFGHFRGIRVLAEALAAEQSDRNIERPLLQLISMDNLTTLVSAFRVSGNTREGLWIAEWIRPFRGTSVAIEAAALSESSGDYASAIDLLAELSPEMDSVVERLTSDAGASAEERDALVAFHCTCAFVLLSKGPRERDDFGRTARDHLAELEHFAAPPTSIKLLPIELRTVHNLWGLMLQDELNWADSVARFRLAVNIPTIYLNRLYGSTINLGRSQRERAVFGDTGRSPRGDRDNMLAYERLGEAIETLKAGYNGKLRIGDVDEAPIGAHNLALGHLYRYAVAGPAGVADELAVLDLKDALARVQEGIVILDRTRSMRKRAMLEVEGTSAEELLNKLGLYKPSDWPGWHERPKVAGVAASESDAEDIGALARVLALPRTTNSHA